nr:MAG TPA: hypothetical protein [Caudoviricetes sp.]
MRPQKITRVYLRSSGVIVYCFPPSPQVASELR